MRWARLLTIGLAGCTPEPTQPSLAVQMSACVARDCTADCDCPIEIPRDAPYVLQTGVAKKPKLSGYALLPWRIAAWEDDDDGTLDIAVALGGDLWRQPVVFFDDLPDGGRSYRAHHPPFFTAEDRFHNQVQHLFTSPGAARVLASTSFSRPRWGKASQRTQTCGSGVLELDLDAVSPEPKYWLEDAMVRDFQAADLDPTRPGLEIAVATESMNRFGCDPEKAWSGWRRWDEMHDAGPNFAPFVRPGRAPGDESLPETISTMALRKEPASIIVLAAPAAADRGVLLLRSQTDADAQTAKREEFFGLAAGDSEHQASSAGFCLECDPGPLRAFDVNQDGHLDLVGTFDRHSLFLATGPFVKPSAADRIIDCGELSLLPGSVSCAPLHGQSVAQLDVAMLADDEGFGTLVAVARGCYAGHTRSSCKGSPALDIWRRSDSHMRSESMAWTHYITAIELLGGTVERPLLAVSGAASHPKSGTLKPSLELVWVAEEHKREPLRTGPLFSFAIDIEPVRISTWAKGKREFPSDGHPASGRVTLPGAVPHRPAQVLAEDRTTEIPSCGNGESPCWTWDARTHSVTLTNNDPFFVVMRETDGLPDLLVANAVPTVGIDHLTPASTQVSQ